MSNSALAAQSFWSKVGDSFKAAGREVTEKALILYYAWMRPETPTWAKGVIAGALVYFICPVDLIPDITPIVGYVDDAGMITAAASQVAASIDSNVIKQAKKKADSLFG